MKIFCKNCGSLVDVFTRRHWRFSSSVVPCPQFRRYFCFRCKKEIPDEEIEKAKMEKALKKRSR
ncbi:MAG: hypothetical protein AMS17_07090 [Spirochaetes bacterium DG_61]|nr:MAG: hypothetical protein AMS17_07090 [Spirochaetes bacterium DG_61]